VKPAHPGLAASIGEHDGRTVLFAQRCGRCGMTLFPLGTECPGCGGDRRDRLAVSSSGTVFSWTAVHRAGTGWKTPYVVALVDFPEGPRVFGQVQADATAMRSGMRVPLAFGTPPAALPSQGYYFVPVGADDEVGTIHHIRPE
jgi:uncharacterized protein